MPTDDEVSIPFVSAQTIMSSDVTEAKEEVSLESLRACLLNQSDPMAKRTRCIFMLRNIGHDAVKIMTEALSDPSVLLSHEVAYCLGQMKDPAANAALTATLEDKTVHPITRHEAAEALAAIGSAESLPVLEKYCDDDNVEVADTCKIAVDKLKKSLTEGNKPSKYLSIDPAPPLSKDLSIEELQDILTNESLGLYDRYQAMFSLRDIGSKDAVEALCAGFSDKSSAVLRHEIAYVLGQVQHEASVEPLTKVLQDETEHAMVRHEAAEALGSIGTEGVTELLQKFQADSDKIVSDSCDVALDIVDYWQDPSDL